MRITSKESKDIKSTIHLLDPMAKVYLFGSRTDDSKKGGDLDLLVISEVITTLNKLDVLVRLKEKIGDQKIDLLIKKQAQFNNDPFCKSLNLIEIL